MAPALLFATGAAAQDCALARYVTGVSMTAGKTNTMMVPVTINGVSKMMMLDTGGGVSQLTRATLSEFNLPEQRSPSRISDIRGDVSTTRAQVGSLTLGNVSFTGKALQVEADPSLGPPFAGLLSGDLLADYDVDIDFGSSRLNLFSPGTCGEHGLYWTGDAVAVIPFTLSGTHITVPVMLDGQKLSAIIDTGAPVTTMSVDAAHRFFNLTGDALGKNLARASTVFAPSNAVYVHQFSSLRFAGVTVNNPVTAITPVRPAGAARGWWTPARRGTLPDLIIGMEILRTLHLYIDYKDRKLYVTGAGKNAADLLPPVEDTAAALSQ